MCAWIWSSPSGEEVWGFRDASVDAARFVPVFPYCFNEPLFSTTPLNFELLMFRLVNVAAFNLLPCCFFFVFEALASFLHPVFVDQKAGSLALANVWSEFCLLF